MPILGSIATACGLWSDDCQHGGPWALMGCLSFCVCVYCLTHPGSLWFNWFHFIFRFNQPDGNVGRLRVNWSASEMHIAHANQLYRSKGFFSVFNLFSFHFGLYSQCSHAIKMSMISFSRQFNIWIITCNTRNVHAE